MRRSGRSTLRSTRWQASAGGSGHRRCSCTQSGSRCVSTAPPRAEQSSSSWDPTASSQGESDSDPPVPARIPLLLPVRDPSGWPSAWPGPPGPAARLLLPIPPCPRRRAAEFRADGLRDAFRPTGRFRTSGGRRNCRRLSEGPHERNRTPMATHATEKCRLVTRSDFDGLVCAALLKELGILDEIKFVHPKDMQDGLVEI